MVYIGKSILFFCNFIFNMAEPGLENVKKCTKCTRAAQPLDQFIGVRGQPVSRCLKCREVAARSEARPEARQRHNELNKANAYRSEYVAKMRADPDTAEEFRKRNALNTANCRARKIAKEK